MAQKKLLTYEKHYLHRELLKKKVKIIVSLSLLSIFTIALTFFISHDYSDNTFSLLGLTGVGLLITLLTLTYYTGQSLFHTKITAFNILDTEGTIEHTCVIDVKQTYYYYYNGHRLRVPKQWEERLHKAHIAKEKRRFRIAQSPCKSQDHYLLKVYDSEWCVSDNSCSA
ncbi:MAG: hypothetical protein OCC49_12000 [Fibrobacterales bacterium]